MIEIIVAVVGGVSVLIMLALLYITKRPATPEEDDEHATMVKPRDKHGRWVKEGDGIIVPKGPSASWNRKKTVRK